MSKGYNNHQSIHNHHFHHKNMFLPIFCRFSVKDINLNNNKTHNTNQTTTDEPSSPKVSCMGQVKRNNRVIGFPTTTTAIVTTSNHQNHKYTKLKRFFSSKTLLPPAPNNVRTGSRSCRTNKDTTCERRLIRSSKNEDDRVLVNVEEMDPPLPVVKKVAPLGEVNIWKRRFNGTKMNGLQIEQIRLPDCRVMDPPTV